MLEEYLWLTSFHGLLQCKLRMVGRVGAGDAPHVLPAAGLRGLAFPAALACPFDRRGSEFYRVSGVFDLFIESVVFYAFFGVFGVFMHFLESVVF